MRDLQDLLSRLHIDLSRCVAETNRCVGLAASSSSARIALNTIEYAIQGADIL